MVLTTLEAEVSPKKWNDLKKAYEKLVAEQEPGLSPLQSWLVQSNEDVNVWQLMGLWRSRNEFEAMRKQGTPRGVKMFRDLGVEPALSLYDVVATTTSVADPMPMSQH
jgi:hypothetical protein